MDTDQANRDRGRATISAWWHLLPWWERVLYVLTTLLFVPAMLLPVLMASGFFSSLEYGPVWSRLLDVDSLLMAAASICFIASTLLTTRRKRPDVWSDVRQLWSARAFFVGSGIIGTYFVWSSVVDLATPLDQLPPDMPSFLVVPAMAVGFLLFGGGIVLVIPELIVRERRAKRRQV
jgi:hypothetical protein